MYIFRLSTGFGLGVVALFFCFFPPAANASEQIFFNNLSSSTNALTYLDDWRYVGQYLPAVSVDNISAIAIHDQLDALPSDYYLAICHGTPAPISTADWISRASTCDFTDNDLVYSETITSEPSATWREFLRLDTPAGMEIGEDYYIVIGISQTPPVELGYYAGAGAGNMILGNGDPQTPGNTLSFSAYYDDEYVPNVVYNYDITSGFAMSDLFICCEGVGCNISGNQAAMAGDTDYTIFSGECASWPWLMNKTLATGTIPAYTSTFLESIASSTGQWPMCYTSERVRVAGDTEYHYIVVNDFSVLYQPATSTECIALEPLDTWCNYPCEGIATSSLGGDIHCGFNSTLAWAFCVSSTSISAITDGAYILRSKFPFSAPFTLLDSIQGALPTTSSSPGFRMPMICDTCTSSRMQMITVLDASSTERTIGRTNALLFRQVMAWFVYIGFAALFALIVWPRKKAS